MILEKKYSNHFGVDLKSSDLDRPDAYASDALNAQYKKSGDLEKRKGIKACAISIGGNGLFNYKTYAETTGITEQALAVSGDLHRLLKASITVSYSGSGTTADLIIFFDVDANEYKAQIVEDSVTVLDESLGRGFDEASIATIADLSTAINALTDFSATTSGDTTTPSAFLDITTAFNLASGNKTIEACYWETVPSPISVPFTGSETNRNTANYENVTGVQLNEVMFFGNGYDETVKYDGQNLYKAGSPTPGAPGIATAAGTVPAGTYLHAYTYENKDAKGNLVEGNRSATVSTTVGGVTDFTVTVANLQADYNINGAMVAGAQVGVTTINVDDGGGGAHTLQAGDTAYFFDGVSGAYVERAITAVAANTITIAGAAVNVADNAPISNNLRINIYRSFNAGTFLFLVESIPNNPFVATQNYVDSKLDSALGVQFIEPTKDRQPPPKGRYITKYNNQLVVLGNQDSPNDWYWSEPDNPEHFDLVENFERAQSENGEPISGGGQANEAMVVFEENAMHVYSGDFTNNNIRHDIVSEKVGCVAHATIQSVENSLYFLSDKGVYSTFSGQLPIEVSQNISPIFSENESRTDELKYILKRAIGLNDRVEERYLLFLPTESDSSGQKYTNQNYLIYVEDYSHNNKPSDVPSVWFPWRFANTNPAAGMIIYEKKLLFIEKRLSTFTGNVDHILYKGLRLNTSYDYMDNDQPIAWTYKTNWYSLGEPSIPKRFNRLKLFPSSQTSSSANNLTIQVEADFVPDVVKNETTISLNGQGLGYGVNPYGTAPYGDTSVPSAKTKLGGKYKTARIVFSNSLAQQNVELSGWELEVAAPYRLEIKE